jgi:hypothetical protein
VCTIIPWRLAFAKDSVEWDTAYYVMDSMFLIDMILTFFTSFPKNDMIEIVDKVAIANRYFKTWFIVDILSIAPFDLIL